MPSNFLCIIFAQFVTTLRFSMGDGKGGAGREEGEEEEEKEEEGLRSTVP
jgi:hypothetical protein